MQGRTHGHGPDDVCTDVGHGSSKIGPSAGQSMGEG